MRNLTKFLPTIAVIIGACGGRGQKFNRVESDVRKALPVGTSAGEAARILDSMGIKHSAFEPGSGRMRALAGPVEKNVITRADAEFVLVFDSSKRLTSISARKVYTGP